MESDTEKHQIRHTVVWILPWQLTIHFEFSVLVFYHNWRSTWKGAIQNPNPCQNTSKKISTWLIATHKRKSKSTLEHCQMMNFSPSSIKSPRSILVGKKKTTCWRFFNYHTSFVILEYVGDLPQTSGHHTVLESTLASLTESRGSWRHVYQNSSILYNMVRVGILTSGESSTYVEFGSGRGKKKK